MLPSLDTLATTAAHLADAAREADDRAGENALNKAIYQLQSGVAIVATAGGYLVPSGTRAGVVHRVSETHGCNCEAATAGRQCWHAAAVEIVEAAQYLTEPVAYQGTTAAYASRPKGPDGYAIDDRRNVPREIALAEMDELYPPR